MTDKKDDKKDKKDGDYSRKVFKKESYHSHKDSYVSEKKKK
jgi:hypothetical protein